MPRFTVAVLPTLLGCLLLATGCEPESTPVGPAVEPPTATSGPRSEPDSGEPADPGTLLPADRGTASEPLEAGTREVELSVNGERVRVVRPSLLNPFVVAAGEYEEGTPPGLDGAPDPNGPSVQLLQERTIEVIRRVPQTVRLSVADPNGVGDIVGYYVQFEGYEGTFFVPTEIDSELYGASLRERGRFTVGFFMDEVFPPGADRDTAWARHYNQAFQVRMRIWAVDRGRHASAPVEQMLNVLPVGRGDLEVTLSMSLPSDLDLYVVEPNGNVIYYANMRSFTNGQLDLDANAACSTNTNVRYEHIFWPEGRVPEGTYQIRVDNWANCVGGRPVDFEVIVQNCGDITVYPGTATGPGGRNDCRDPRQHSCQHVATVQVYQCDDQDRTQ